VQESKDALKVNAIEQERFEEGKLEPLYWSCHFFNYRDLSHPHSLFWI